MCFTPLSFQGCGVVEKIRNPAVAGQFYPGAEKNLRQQIEECFNEKRGSGSIPVLKEGKALLKGFVVPHAGYVYSGAIASHAYARLAETGFADSFVILGPNHTGMGSGVSIMMEGSWKTPFGTIPLDFSLARMIAKGIVDQDSTAHMYEHSIEVQLPFLQYISKDRKFEFVPLCMMMQDFTTATEVGDLVADAIQKSSKNVVIIASSDFSHVGFNYQSMPPSGVRVDHYAEKQDAMAIKKILALDPEGLIHTVEEHSITMCGYGPVAAMLTAAKKLGASKAELLKYGTSYAVHPDSSCVGYGAIVIT